MNEYYLFLDESLPIGPLTYFCLAGCIIKKDDYINKIIPAINLLKSQIFNKTDIILHDSDIRSGCGDFYCLRDAKTREAFWAGIHKIFINGNIIIIGAGVSVNIQNTIYKSTHVNSNYHIALQIVLENFVYFLEQHNAKGSVLIESTNETADSRLINLYHSIVSTGTLFLGRNAFQKHLTTINFYIKQDNNIGLQLADFVPNAVNRKISGLPPKQYSLADIIEANTYDGLIGLKNKFGLKIIE